MKKKALPVGTMFLILVIALAAVGVGYALWSETLTIEGTVQTGEVDVAFSTYEPVECVDTQQGLCQPEPEEKDAAATCEVVWGGPDGDSEGDDGYDNLLVTVNGIYPSYHCKVSFDVTSLGNVPVHVKWPEPNGDIPEWVATDFETCYADGVQLHQNESTDPCTIDIHFNNDQAPPEGSGPYTFGWTILAHQWNEDPPSGPFVNPGAPADGWTKAASLRIKGAPGDDVYLGVEDLGVSTNRVQFDAGNPLANGTYPVTFTFDQANNKLLANVNGTPLVYDFASMPAPACATSDWNAMTIIVRDSKDNGGVGWQNVMLDGIPLGNFAPPDGTPDVAGIPGWQEWGVTGYDFSNDFTVTADMVVNNLNANESLKLEFGVGCLP